MEGVVVSAMTGAMRTLLPKLSALLEKKYKLSKDVEKEITFLKDEMSSMNALLMKLDGIEDLDLQDKNWRDKVRELSYEMEDCIDIFMNGHDCGDTKAGVLSKLKKLKARWKTIKQIEEFKARVVEISNCRNRLRISQPSQPHVVAIDPQILAFCVDTTSLVGIDGPRDTIMEWLMEGQQVQQLWPCLEHWSFARFLHKSYCSLQNFMRDTVKSIPSKEIKLISIVGSGGAGKTTLANQVYSKIKSQFDCTAFVSVTQNPNRVKILSDILLGVEASVSSSCAGERQLINELRGHTKDKRYLIVIDDLWTLDAWTTIKCLFLENNRGSRVIVTTRSEDVAQECCSSFHGRVYKIKPLNNLDSRRLFQRRIFRSEDACPEELNNVSDEIVKKCEGLPIAILCIASILSRDKELMREQSWERIRNSLGFQFERTPIVEQMRHVLNLGYSSLSLDLRTCMLYLGVFPEDSEIMKADLMRRWIAEGLVSDEYTCRPEEVAESYFNELINMSMIQIAGFDDCGEVVSCRVHDLMLDFIISNSTEENFMTVINYQRRKKSSLKVRRLSLQVRNPGDDQVPANLALVQARSLNFWGPAQLMPSLSRFKVLRVLHLEVHDSNSERYDVSSIRNFFNLRYLRIRGIGCEEMLKQLRNLQHLKTLDVVPVTNDSGWLDVGELPLSLLHLIVPYTMKLFGGISRMSALLTLGELSIDLVDVESMKGLGELSNLRELKLVLHQGAAKCVCDNLVCSLCSLISLQSLTIRMRGSLDVDVLTCWSRPSRHLRRLHVLGLPFSTVSDWITQLNNLRSLKIQVVSLPRNGAEVLATLTLLVHLTLHVRKHDPEEGVVIRSASFPNLKDFVFRYQVPCLMFEAGAMDKLQSLTIEFYAEAEQRDDGVLYGIEHLRSLKAFNIFCKLADINPGQGIILQCGPSSSLAPPPHPKKLLPTWYVQSLEATLRKAINKHPGSPDIRIQYV